MSTTSSKPDILYSFRRCPYAMRARMAICASGALVELRDILLKDKPAQMLDASPKATVPVLVCSDNQILEESRDIMLWAMQQADPENWYPVEPRLRTEINTLIDENDGPFKTALDRYKYHVRFPESPREKYRKDGEAFLVSLEQRLTKSTFLLGDAASLADIAIFPFVRQFANSDRDWFYAADYPALQKWLDRWIASDLFQHIMKKRPLWQSGKTGPLFPTLTKPDDI